MDTERLHQLVAAIPGTIGQHYARRIAVNQIAAGSVDHAAALAGIAGPAVILALIEAEASPAMLRAAIQNRVLFGYRELPAFIAANGGRGAFAGWCRKAEFAPSEPLPETVEIYRGTLGCSPAAAVAGLHWSRRFDDAAFYAARFADTDLTGVIVLSTKVRREDIVMHVSGTAHQEVVTADVPSSFEIITDKERIGDAAVRNALRLHDLQDKKGWTSIDVFGTAPAVAFQARARMQLAGVARGTAIVA